MRPCLILALLSAAAPAAAQDRVRLDDFAIPAVEETIGIDQLAPAESEPLPPQQQADRTLGEAQRPEEAGTALPAQLSGFGEATTPTQLATRATSRESQPDGVSTAMDSKPGPAASIAGHDRCDPASQDVGKADCTHVIERRADEFPRRPAPELSPEQKLLSEQPELDGGQSVDLATRRLSRDAEPQTTIEQAAAAIAFDSTRKSTAETGPSSSDALPDFLPSQPLPTGPVVGVPIVK